MGTRKTTTTPSVAEIPKSPFKEAGVLQVAIEKVQRGLQRETESGVAKPPSKPPAGFIAAQKKASVAHSELPRMDPPHWARKLIADKADPAAVAQAAAARAVKTPDEATLREVEAVLNELGRHPERAAALKRAVVAENLDKVLK